MAGGGWLFATVARARLLIFSAPPMSQFYDLPRDDRPPIVVSLYTREVERRSVTPSPPDAFVGATSSH